MTAGPSRCIVGIVAAGSLLVSSSACATGAFQSQQVSPWAALAALSGGAPAAAMCGSSQKNLAQPTGSGCLLPTIPASPASTSSMTQSAGYGVTPLLLGLAAIASAVGFWFAVDDNHYRRTTPVSPD